MEFCGGVYPAYATAGTVFMFPTLRHIRREACWQKAAAQSLRTDIICENGSKSDLFNKSSHNILFKKHETKGWKLLI